MADFADGPLSGIRVIDLTSVVMGPLATRILGDMGADIIKIEGPEGDSTRNYRPLRNPGMSGMHLNLNRNKRSVCLDLKRPDARNAVLDLARNADVFVHSLRPDSIERLGLHHEAVRAVNPEIVYCGAYGFGSGGPYRTKSAYDDIIQAASGIAALAAHTTGEPRYAPTVICDKLTGQAIAYAISAALVRRFRGGGGANIEVPMFETSIDFMLAEHFGGGVFDPALSRMGFPRVLATGRKPYRTADGFVCILPYSDANWRDFFQYVGLAHLAGDPRYSDLPTRVQHIEELYAIVEREAAHRTVAEWVSFCDSAGIPCMPVLQLDDLPQNEHVSAVGLFQTYEHPTEGRYRATRPPVIFDGQPQTLRHHAPVLGEHTEEILRTIGASR